MVLGEAGGARRWGEEQPGGKECGGWKMTEMDEVLGQDRTATPVTSLQDGIKVDYQIEIAPKLISGHKN